MNLYGFSAMDCTTSVYPVFKRVIPLQLYDVGTKYMVAAPREHAILMMTGLFKFWKDHPVDHGWEVGNDQDEITGWVWRLAHDMEVYVDHHLRDKLLKHMRRDAHWIVANVGEERFREGLLRCPRLAMRMAMTGGLNEHGLVFHKIPRTLPEQVVPAKRGADELEHGTP